MSRIIAGVFILVLGIADFFTVSCIVAKIPGVFGNNVRYRFYKGALKSVGNDVTISYGCVFSHRTISIGDRVRLGPFNTVGLVNFGNDIIVAQNVHFLSGKNQHGYERRDIPMREQKGSLVEVRIHDDVWIGANSVIHTDVMKGTVVGSMSLVLKTFGEYSIIGGVPARLLKSR